MSAVPAASYLIEFGPDGALGAERSWGGPAGPKADDPGARIAEAHARGFEEGMAAARAQGDAEVERCRVEFARKLASDRQAWVTETAEGLSGQIGSGLGGMEKSIADAAAQVLKPFLIAELRRRAIDELLEVVRGLLSKDQGIALEISGPDDLVEALRNRLPEGSGAVRFSAGEGSDVHVIADQTIIETRLGSWVAKIEEAAP